MPYLQCAQCKNLEYIKQIVPNAITACSSCGAVVTSAMVMPRKSVFSGPMGWFLLVSPLLGALGILYWMYSVESNSRKFYQTVGKSSTATHAMKDVSSSVPSNPATKEAPHEELVPHQENAPPVLVEEELWEGGYDLAVKEQVVDPEVERKEQPLRPSGTSQPTGQRRQYKAPGKWYKSEGYPGYYVKNYAGFVLYISRRANEMSEDKDGQPLGMLEEELLRLSKQIPQNSATWRNDLMIWIDWDTNLSSMDDPPFILNNQMPAEVRAQNGARSTISIENFRSNGPPEAAREKFRQRSIYIPRLHDLYESVSREGQNAAFMTQPLAFHYFRNVCKSKADVESAMARAKIKGLYGANTFLNSPENYFSALSSCYLDEIDIGPKNGMELKVYDPAGYEIMAAAWGEKQATESTEPTSNR